MSKGVKKVVGIVAAIAIPFAAPLLAPLALSAKVGYIAASVGFSGTVAAGIGSAVSAGLTGAVMGGAAAALTGGKWEKGALLGGLGSAISGGLKGYGAAKTMQAGGTAAMALGVNPPGSWTDGVGGLAPGVTTTPGVTTAPGAAAAGGATSILKSIGASLGKVAPDILTRAAIYLASGQLSAANPDERRLIEEAAARMREIQGQDDALYQQLLQEAMQIDPSAQGEQWYTDAKLQGIAATEAATENMSPRGQGAIAEVTRRGLQDASLNATLAYRSGYDSAANNRRAAIGAAGAVPRTNAAAEALGLRYGSDDRRNERRRGIVSSLTGLATGAGMLGGLPEENEDPRVRAGLAD